MIRIKPSITSIYKALALLAGGVLLAACQPRVYDDPIGVMVAGEVTSQERLEAARQAHARSPDDPRRIEAIRGFVYNPGHSAALRIYAIDQLLQHDGPRYRQQFAHNIAWARDREVRHHILNLAAERRWQEFTPAIVRIYAMKVRGIKDADGLERQTLEKLHPGKSAKQVIFEVFAEADPPHQARDQAAAWELLNRLLSRQELLRLLDAAPNTTPVVIDLKAAVAELKTMPTDGKGVLWLSYLRDPGQSAFWNAAKAQVARLSARQQRRLELRHLPALVTMADMTLLMDEAVLRRELAAALGRQQHHHPAPGAYEQHRDDGQRLSEALDKMGWADLATIRLINQALRRKPVIDALFKQADADYEDTTTEYGGVLDHEESGFSARLYKPIVYRHDRKFYTPVQMIVNLYTAVAHYHFHAQVLKNRESAGPGRGDLKFVERFNFNCLVFTFIDRNRLNVDYYQPGGIVIDLGTLRRSSAPPTF